MKLVLKLENNKRIELPLQYNHIVQAFIYNNIDKELANFLHDKGYVLGNRIFKLFTFSKIYGKYSIDKESKKIYFESPIEIIIKTPVEKFANSLLNSMILKSDLILGINNLKLSEYQIINDSLKIQLDDEKNKNITINIKTLSPITVYSTLKTADDKNYTCYFLPGDPKFNELINSNLEKKSKLLKIDNFNNLKILKHRGKVRMLIYKGFYIKAYDGILTLNGDYRMLDIALSCGLGSKNSQGLGAIDLINIEKKGGDM